MPRRIVQKFKRGQRVYIRPLDPTMRHFEQKCYGIVRHTYHQMYGGGNTSDYCIAIMNSQDVIVNCVSWYPERSLLPSVFSDHDLRKLERYCNGRF